MLIRREHWTDVPLDGQKRRRVVKNWANYRASGREWAPASPQVMMSPGVPDIWKDRFDFKAESQGGALQSFLEDTSDVDNPAMVGCRIASRPGLWLNMKACDVAKPASSTTPEYQKWDGLWPNTELSFTPKAHKLTKLITLLAKGHPTIFRFTLRCASGMSVVFGNRGAKLLDSKGSECMRVLAPWAFDAKMSPIRVRLEQGNSRFIDGRLLDVVKLIVSKTDLETATYPIVIDPTVIISGTTDIEDAELRVALSGTPPRHERNYGGSVAIGIRIGSGMHNAIIRVKASALPAGTYSEFRFKPFLSSGSTQTWTAYRIVDANDWVEGTLTGTNSEVGSCCWDYAKFNTQQWVGGMSGADGVGDNDGVGDSQSIVSGANTWILPTTWAQDWKSGARVDNGFVCTGGVSFTSTRIDSSEGGTPPTFEIDYAAPAAGGPSSAGLARRIS